MRGSYNKHCAGGHLVMSPQPSPPVEVPSDQYMYCLVCPVNYHRGLANIGQSQPIFANKYLFAGFLLVQISRVRSVNIFRVSLETETC